jgi:hypothetical protein
VLNELTRDQFLATFVEPVHHLSGDEPYSGPPIGGYVRECVRQRLLPIPVEQLEIHHVYRNGEGENGFYHILLYFREPNVYLVVVVDCKQVSVYGHYTLDLNEEYGLGGGGRAEPSAPDGRECE